MRPDLYDNLMAEPTYFGYLEQISSRWLTNPENVDLLQTSHTLL